MSYQPNTPAVLVRDQVDVPDVRCVCLAEFGEGSPIREVLMDPASDPKDAKSTNHTCSSCANFTGIFYPGCPCPKDRKVHKSNSACDHFSVHPPGFKPTDTPKKPMATASGLRLHSVHAPDGTVLARYDAEQDRTPLDFLKEGPRVVACARPGKTYSWQLVELGKPTPNGNLAPITGARPATTEEGKVLDEMYPGWLASCEKFDKEHAPVEKPKSRVPAPILPRK
jgi:hypothetical protein